MRCTINDPLTTAALENVRDAPAGAWCMERECQYSDEDGWDPAEEEGATPEVVRAHLENTRRSSQGWP